MVSYNVLLTLFDPSATLTTAEKETVPRVERCLYPKVPDRGGGLPCAGGGHSRADLEKFRWESEVAQCRKSIHG